MPDAPAHARRRAALRDRLAAADLDALLVADLCNVRYLTGFTGSNAAVLVATAGEDGTVFCTDGRYDTQAAGQVPDLARLIDRPCDLALAGRAAGQSLRRVGFESQHVTVDGYDALADAAGAAQLLRAPGHVEALRAVKDDGEIEALRTACAVADRALAELLDHGGLRPGRTELDVARDLEARMVAGGAQGPAFDTIVAAGPHSAVPHHRPTGTVLADGDLLKLDFGALVDGYHSDMTRTLVLGTPAAWQRELYDLVAQAQAAGRAALVAGAGTADVDDAARRVVAGAGHADEFPHGLGHGVGLQVHEAPMMGKTADGTLSTGMAVTVEPGVYLPGRGGVRIEDTLVVRGESAGSAELLTLTTKDLVVVE